MFWPLLLLQAVPALSVPSPALPVPPVPGGGRGAVPLENPGTWLRSDDYPAPSLEGLEEGITGFGLTIDATGKVRECRILSSSGYPLLDETTCRVMTERGRFAPARDTRGMAVEGRYASRLRWVLPIQHLPLPTRQAMVFSFIVEADGKRSDCRVEYALRPDGIGAIRGAVPCGVGKFDQPFRDKDGKPVRRRVTRTVVTLVEDVTEPVDDAEGPARPGDEPAPRPD